ncbi:MAG: cellulase family glycosylhydrolase, partial [Planctomycetota bacterium]
MAPRTAHTPEPADGTRFVNPRNVILSWTQGSKATRHYVYFDDDFDTVNNAAGAPPQEATTFAPGPLEFEKTYYWRVDEFDGSSIHKGEVWSFRTSPETTTVITSLSQNEHTVGRYEKFELTFTLPESYDNPFDLNVVDITVAIGQPNGNTIAIPAFFYQEYDYIYERYVNVRNPCWKARFAPSQVGEHLVSQITIVDANGSNTIDPQVTFTCIESDERGFIRTDQRDRYYLRYANGQPYLPIGHNVCWLPDGPGDWENYFTSMGAVGENWTRIWMTHFFEGQILEWSSNHWSGYFQGVGQFSLPMAKKIDQMIELAEQNGIGVQLVFQQDDQFNTTNPNWNQNPYNISNAAIDGGFLENPDDFFTDGEAIRLTKNKYRYIVARWGYSCAILAWELWNEVQYTDGWRSNREAVVAWHDEMSDYISSIDPFKHLITTSSDASGFDALWSLDNIDVIQVHHYGAEMIGFFSNTATRLASHGKPIIMGEFGAGRTGNVDVPENDYN